MAFAAKLAAASDGPHRCLQVLPHAAAAAAAAAESSEGYSAALSRAPHCSVLLRECWAAAAVAAAVAVAVAVAAATSSRLPYPVLLLQRQTKTDATQLEVRPPHRIKYTNSTTKRCSKHQQGQQQVQQQQQPQRRNSSSKRGKRSTPRDMPTALRVAEAPLSAAIAAAGKREKQHPTQKKQHKTSSSSPSSSSSPASRLSCSALRPQASFPSLESACQNFATQLVCNSSTSGKLV